MNKEELFTEIAKLTSEIRAINDEKTIQKKIAEVSAKSAVLIGLNLADLKNSIELTNSIISKLKESTENSIKNNELESKKAKSFSLISFIASLLIALSTILLSWYWWSQDNRDTDTWHREQVESLHHLEHNSDSLLQKFKYVELELEKIKSNRYKTQYAN